MLKRFFTLTFLVFFTLNLNSQSKKIEIKKKGIKESNYLQMDNFYLTHYLYIDLFLRESLFTDADADEVSMVLNGIKKYVAEGIPLEIEIKKPGKTNYKLKVGILKKDGEELLIAFTNWNPKKKEFEKDMGRDSYTRWYFLNGNKMTYRKDMSKENNYRDMDKVDLANAYLFDEIAENDDKIIGIIDEILAVENLDIKDKMMSNLILLKYYILTKEDEKIKSQVDYLKTEFAAYPLEQKLKGLEMAFKATEFQIELMP